MASTLDTHTQGHHESVVARHSNGAFAGVYVHQVLQHLSPAAFFSIGHVEALARKP